MGVPVAIVDPLPMFVRGLAATLTEQGYRVETPDDPVAWAGRPGRTVVLVTVLTEAHWKLLADLAGGAADTLVLALIEEVEPDGFARAIAVGAGGVLARGAPPETVLDGIRALCDGATLVPLAVLRRLLTRGDRPAPVPALSAAEVGWLRGLAAGTTVSRLADQAGYSERMMFRLLAGVYAKVGAANRTAALMAARDRGLL